MKTLIRWTFLSGVAVTSLTAQNLIWSDNFDVLDSANFDGAPLEGRRAGEFPGDFVARSAGTQQQIQDMQLRLGGGRIRFELPPGGAPIRSYDFAAGSVGANILDGGGLRVEFDYVPTDNTSTNWISVSVGFPKLENQAEPGTRLNFETTDFGFLIRNEGRTQFFKNGVPGDDGVATATTGSRHVVVNYGFTSLANGSPFTVTATVDGLEVINQSHQWSGNLDQLCVEIGTNQAGTLVDNLQFFELTPSRLVVRAESPTVVSATNNGEIVTELLAMIGGLPGGATYELVAGEGDTDNSKFQISGGNLTLADVDLKGENTTEGQTFSIRVRGTSSGADPVTAESVLSLTVIKDDDDDGILDAYEIAMAGNITDLNGDDIADFDGDGLTDLEEYLISLGTSTLYEVQYVDIDPTKADTDGDGLSDLEEISPSGSNLRYPTDPTLADTDGDGLSDGVETSTLIYVSPTDTGTDPTLADTDGDGLSDGFEVENSPPYDPLVSNSSDDFDGDGLITLDEVFYGSSVLLADTDGDGLEDFDEVFPIAPRVATHPNRVDTDFDGLSDIAETNSGIYASATDTGTSGAEYDSDGDGAMDGYEVEQGTDPLDYASTPPIAAGFAVKEITTDLSSEIGTDKVYTHKISGGVPATVNGVQFDLLTVDNVPANFSWDVTQSGNQRNVMTPVNNGQWVPAEGDVTEPGLLGLLGGFTYSAHGAGFKQIYTLSGLTPGTNYEFRFYIRRWDPSTRRAIDLTFTNGNETAIPYRTLMEDRPENLFKNDNPDTAYYLSYSYTAQTTELEIEAKIPEGAVDASGSFHMYGLTNEVVGESTAGELMVTSVRFNAAGELLIDFTGEPDTAYSVTKSSDLVSAFAPLETPLSVTTSPAGVGQAVVPAGAASGAKGFFRLQR